MRRTASRVVCCAGLLICAGVSAPVSESLAATLTLDVPTAKQHSVLMSAGGTNGAGRTWGYWGRFGGTRIGSYHGTCVWLAGQTWSDTNRAQDDRVACTIVVVFRWPSNQGNDALILEGLIRRPKIGADQNLFQAASKRHLAVTGGAGQYKDARGYVDVNSTQFFTIHIS